MALNVGRAMSALLPLLEGERKETQSSVATVGPFDREGESRRHGLLQEQARMKSAAFLLPVAASGRPCRLLAARGMRGFSPPRSMNSRRREGSPLRNRST